MERHTLQKRVSSIVCEAQTRSLTRRAAGGYLTTWFTIGTVHSIAPLGRSPRETAMQWLSRYERFWSEKLDQLAAFVEENACSPSQASPSSAKSKHRPRKSSARGQTRRK